MENLKGSKVQNIAITRGGGEDCQFSISSPARNPYFNPRPV